MMGDTNVSFKSVFKDEVRRFVVDSDVSTSLTFLREKLVSIYPELKRHVFYLTWNDDEGDRVTIKTDEELFIALTDMKVNTFLLGFEALRV
jgi:hypothetical protein